MEEKGAEEVCPRCGYAAGAGPESPLQLKPGTILNGKYWIGRVLGHGGFGITYLACDLNLGLKLAVKEYFPQGMATRQPHDATISVYSGATREQFEYGLEKFIDEARTLARFDAVPEIVTAKDFFRENGTAYLAMSYVDGITLKEYVNRQGGRLRLDGALTLLLPVLKALEQVHEAGILHRDISPDNIYVTRSYQVKLLDFGAARLAMGEHSKSLSVLLKPGYAPEEQYRSRGKQGPWTDVYAVGATMYRLLTGVNPPEALDRLQEDEMKRPSELGAELPAEVEAVLLKALSVRGSERYQSAGALRSALEAAAASSGRNPVQTENGQAASGAIAGAPMTAGATAGVLPGPSAAASPISGLEREAEQRQAGSLARGAFGFNDSSSSRKYVKPLLAIAAVLVLIIGGIRVASQSREPQRQEASGQSAPLQQIQSAPSPAAIPTEAPAASLEPAPSAAQATEPSPTAPAAQATEPPPTAPPAAQATEFVPKMLQPEEQASPTPGQLPVQTPPSVIQSSSIPVSVKEKVDFAENARLEEMAVQINSYDLQNSYKIEMEELAAIYETDLEEEESEFESLSSEMEAVVQGNDRQAAQRLANAILTVMKAVEGEVEGKIAQLQEKYATYEQFKTNCTLLSDYLVEKQKAWADAGMDVSSITTNLDRTRELFEISRKLAGESQRNEGELSENMRDLRVIIETWEETRDKIMNWKLERDGLLMDYIDIFD
jgi:serine/threonine protein kinase